MAASSLDAMVSREYTATAVSSIKDHNWAHNHNAHDTGQFTYPNHQARRPTGPTKPHMRSRQVEPLIDIASRNIAKNIEKYDLHYLNSIRPELLLRIWDRYYKSHGSFSGSLYAWKAFNMAAKRLLGKQNMVPDGEKKSDVSISDQDYNTPLLRRFCHRIRLPTADFNVYIKPLQATRAFDFVSHIRVAGVNHIRTEDLLLLPSLRNLGVLEIIEGQLDSGHPRISDRIIRTWSEDKAAFPNLLVLKIFSRFDVTMESLQYLARFPALAVFEIQAKGWSDCKKVAATTGWLEMMRSLEEFHGIVDPYRSVHEDRCEWACMAYQYAQTSLKTKSLGTPHNEKGLQTNDGSGLTIPFASLCLGGAQDTILRGPQDRKVFRRREPSDTVQDDGSISKKLRKTGHGQSEGGGQSSKKRQMGPGQSAGSSQPKKRRQTGIGDLLNDFQC